MMQLNKEGQENVSSAAFCPGEASGPASVEDVAGKGLCLVASRVPLGSHLAHERSPSKNEDYGPWARTE